MKSVCIFLSLLLLLILTCTILISCGDDDDDDNDGDDDTSDDDDAGDDDDDDTDAALSWLYARNGEQRAIFDGKGREMLLRGVNFNHLGDYFENDPSLPTVAELGADDWDDAAALGINVIRLVTTWSFWEPERDQFDEDYLAKVRAAVAEANARGMYVVIDIHQDAWSKFVFTPVDEVCPPGTKHQIGWDGAPQWATFTDNEPTCTPGSREQSPAVIRAWDNFYANRDGIQDELVELWGRIATEFVDEPGVAGYDLLNEPGNAENLLTTYTGLSDFYRNAIQAIREAEAGSSGHIIFFEPNVSGVPPAFELNDDNLVFAAHNYFAAIVPGPLELLDFSFRLYDLLGRLFYQTPLWIGEYNGFCGNQTDDDVWTTRFAALEDQYLLSGSAWWQWEQACGDPHGDSGDVGGSEYPPTPEWLEEQITKCGDSRMRQRACLNRGYPRAAPGRLLSINVEPCDGGDLIVTGATDSPGVAELWFPSDSEEEPLVTGAGINEVKPHRVDGGWRIDVTVGGDYNITVTESLSRN